MKFVSIEDNEAPQFHIKTMINYPINKFNLVINHLFKHLNIENLEIHRMN